MNLQEAIRNAKDPYIIAGPCSVETPIQLEEIVQNLSKNTSIKMIRAGVWKPRTRPGSFQGVGEIGLSWIKEIKKKYAIPFCVEVANPTHVKLALKAGIDALWIGARTTVNPFAVQDIVDALEGVNLPILIKNPINPDVQLWMGAFERFMNAGITDLTAVHRGFSIYHHPKYRNVPSWEIPIALKEHFPQIPILCDPSHITGDRTLIPEVAQKALDLNFDGLMIETHPHPEQALSDVNQQVTPDDLIVILNKLKKRDSLEKDYHLQLEIYREQLHQLDDGLFDILRQRMLMSDKLGDFKKEANLPILSVDHWKKILEERLSAAAQSNLSEEFVRTIMDAIHQESIRHQNEIMNCKEVNTPNKSEINLR